jgi:hypothetical protein
MFSLRAVSFDLKGKSFPRRPSSTEPTRFAAPATNWATVTASPVTLFLGSIARSARV